MQWLQRNMPTVTITALVTNLVLMVSLYVWSVVKSIPITALLSGTAVVASIVLMAFVMLIPDDTQSQQTERILNMASETFKHMQGGLSPETCQATCALVLEETAAMAVGMTSTTSVLGFAGEIADEFPLGSPIHTRETHAVLQSGHTEIFAPIKIEHPTRSGHVSHSGHPTQSQRSDRPSATDGDMVPAGIIVPLKIQGNVVGTIKFYYRQPTDIDRTEVVIARGIGDLLSTQLNAYALDRQSELTAIAEVKALQAQINPHFLFNTLNTIAAFTRTDPDRAYDLLREFAAFYRQTLDNSSGVVSLAKEFKQTGHYLTLEIARFGEHRIKESSHIDPGLEAVTIPSFIVQPIVENAVCHAMSDEGVLHIDVQATISGDDILITVTDDGLGMDEQTVQALFDEPAVQRIGVDGTPQDRGAHIALRNIAARLKRSYGEGAGIEVVSEENRGTIVTLCLAGALAEPAAQ